MTPSTVKLDLEYKVVLSRAGVMFNIKHPMSIRLHRWMAVVLALGVFIAFPLAQDKLLSQALAAPNTSAVSTTEELWTDPADTATQLTAAKATASGWLTGTPNNGDDGSLELYSSDTSSAGTSTSTYKLLSTWSFRFQDKTYKNVNWSTNGYITFDPGMSNYGTIPSSLSTITNNGFMICGSDKDVRAGKMYYRLDSSNNLHLRFEGYHYNSSFASTPMVFEITLMNNSSVLKVAVGPMADCSPLTHLSSTTYTSANTNSGAFSATSVTAASTILQAFPNGVPITNSKTIFTLGGLSLSRNGGSTITTNINTEFLDTITASGGTGAVTFSLTPTIPGITINPSTGLLSVNLGTKQTVIETVTATDSLTSTKLVLTININDRPSLAVSNSTTTTTVGRAVVETITVSTNTGTDSATGGSGAMVFTLQSSPPASFIRLDTSTAGSRFVRLRIDTASAVAGTYYETITVRDNVGDTATALITVVINPAISIVGETTTALMVTSGTARGESITATYGTGVKTFTLASSPFNAGITLDTSTAASGTVRLRVNESVTAGTYIETITATDTRGATGTLTKTVTVSNGIVFADGDTSTFAASAGTAAYDTMTVSGGTRPLTFTVDGTTTVPGVNANSVITISKVSDTQTVLNVSSTASAGTYFETVTATDSAGAVKRHVVTVTVAGPVRFDPANTTTINTSFRKATSAVFNTVSGNTGKVFTLAPASVESSTGITLETSTGSSFATLRVSSTVPTGTYLVNISVVDASNSRAVTQVTVNVNSAPTIAYDSITAGTSFSSITFNGTTNFLTVPASTDWQTLGGNYTFEWWQYQTDTNANTRIFELGSVIANVNNGSIWFTSNGSNAIYATTQTVINSWNHIAVVCDSGTVLIYLNGRLISTPTATPNISSTYVSNLNPLYIGNAYVNASSSAFGGQLANLTISRVARYSGRSTTSANFTPSKFNTVDANTLLAIATTDSKATFTDLSSSSRKITYNNTFSGSSAHPALPGANPITISATQGTSLKTSAFTAGSGTGLRTLALTPPIAGITLDTSTANVGYINLSSTLTALNGTTPNVFLETVTVTDATNTTTSLPLRIVINPPLSLTAFASPFTTTERLLGVDTITATSGTGAISFALESLPFSSGITLETTTASANQRVLTISRSVPAGTYYETITATDATGAIAVLPITVTVNPGVSLSTAGDVSTINTTVGATAALEITASNGSRGYLFRKQTALSPTHAGITLDTSTVSTSSFATLRVSSAVTAGTYQETVTVTDSQGGTASVLITIIVSAPPSFTAGPTTITTTAGVSQSTAAYSVTGGTGTRTFTLAPIISGVTLDTSTPTAPFVVLGTSLTSVDSRTARILVDTVTVTDSSGITATRALTITVNPPVLETATATSITTTSGIARSVTIFATQGTGNKSFSRTSAIASSAITMSSTIANQAVLSIGSNTSPGTYYETITATDTLNASFSLVITITVNGTPVVTGASALTTTQGIAFNSSLFQASGGNGTYTFSLVSNPVSGGIRVISPTAGFARIIVADTVTAGTYNETLTVTDGLGATGFTTFTIRVNAPVALTGTQTITTTYGTGLTSGFNSSGGTGPFTFSTANICAVSRSTFIGDGTGGTINGTSYTVDQILGTGTCNWISPAGVESASVLVVAGGGAGGTRAGGGGGAGGYQYVASQAITPNTEYAVTVGAGGVGVLTDSAKNGDDSRFGTLDLVKGGGGGGGAITPGITARSGKDGGSGGGAAGYTTLASASIGRGTAGQGNDGANAVPDNAWPGGGGGGAGGAGTSAASNISTAGKGGAGIANSITGTSVCYATGGGAGTKNGYTEGQAGDCGGASSPNGGIGTSGSSTPSNPKPNTGAGGGGSGWSTSNDLVGGNGASGIVVLRYVTPTVEASTNKMGYIVSSPGSISNPGLLNLSIPQSVNAGSYTQTVKVTDSTGAVSSTVTLNITVNKADPILGISLPGGGTSVPYGFGVQVSAQANTPGTFSFTDSGTVISGCGSRSTVSFVATCRWIPSVVGIRNIRATFTPNVADQNNFNSGVFSTLAVTVTKADTLTVTANSENFTFNNSAVPVTRGYTITGLTEIDSVTAVTMTYIGTANDSSTVNSTSAPTKAGSGYEIRPSNLVFNSGSSSNYVFINYVSGALAINRALNASTFNYSNSNSLFYALTGVDSPTVTRFGEVLPTFTGSTPDKCSIQSSNGLLSILQAGTCTVTMTMTEGFNYLSTSVTRDVNIKKASRTITLSASSGSINYGDSATVTTSITGGQEDGVLTYTSSTPSVCQYDAVGGFVLAVAGSGTCRVSASISVGTNFESATASALTLSADLANSPTVTADSIPTVSYDPNGAYSVTPTFTVSGLKLNDRANSATFTYGFQSSPVGSFSYSSTNLPTEGGTYSVTPSSLTMRTGTLNNYRAPIYVASSWTIEQVDQPQLFITNLTGELSFPIKLIAEGGAPSITNIVYAVSGGSATNCRVVYGPITVGGPDVWSLQADSAGSCSVRAAKLQTRNYKTVISDTATVNVLLFTKYVQAGVTNFTTGVTISSAVPITKGSNSCTSGCVPMIISLSSYTGYVGDMLILTGVNFAGATRVIFNVFTNATNFNNDPSNPDTSITVQVPTGLNPGEVGIEVVAPGGTSPRNFDFELLP